MKSIYGPGFDVNTRTSTGIIVTEAVLLLLLLLLHLLQDQIISPNRPLYKSLLPVILLLTSWGLSMRHHLYRLRTQVIITMVTGLHLVDLLSRSGKVIPIHLHNLPSNRLYSKIFLILDRQSSNRHKEYSPILEDSNKLHNNSNHRRGDSRTLISSRTNLLPATNNNKCLWFNMEGGLLRTSINSSKCFNPLSSYNSRKHSRFHRGNLIKTLEIFIHKAKPLTALILDSNQLWLTTKTSWDDNNNNLKVLKGSSSSNINLKIRLGRHYCKEALDYNSIYRKSQRWLLMVNSSSNLNAHFQICHHPHKELWEDNYNNHKIRYRRRLYWRERRKTQWMHLLILVLITMVRIITTTK
mmetsp:Transcript_56625/g.61317  ORF Transcript_56625/g.61317 Transcript_56625/m.61317 type:complete len:354 (+) Transcript_56625:379-1440(+)